MSVYLEPRSKFISVVAGFFNSGSHDAALCFIKYGRLAIKCLFLAVIFNLLTRDHGSSRQMVRQ